MIKLRPQEKKKKITIKHQDRILYSYSPPDLHVLSVNYN